MEKQCYYKEQNGNLYPVTVIAIGWEGTKDALVKTSDNRQYIVQLSQLVFVEIQPAFY